MHKKMYHQKLQKKNKTPAFTANRHMNVQRMCEFYHSFEAYNLLHRLLIHGSTSISFVLQVFHSQNANTYSK